MFRFKSKNIVYICIILVPFIVFFSRPVLFHQFKSRVIQGFIAPIKLMSYPLYELKKILFYHRTFNEYQRLREEVDLLRNRLIGQEELVKENARLGKLLEFKRSLVFPAIAAQVVGRNPSYWNSTVIVDKGSLDGIEQGMGVVNDSGVVGKVSEVGESTSKVILLIDPTFSVAALVQRERESVLISGSLQGACQMRYINDDADIRLGDSIITSKLSESFPEGIMVGRVAQIKGSGRRQYVIQPTVTLSQLEEVLIIRK